jgi:tryptophan halogenase
MSQGANPIKQVVVAGGGIVGWSAAVALKRRLPGLSVTIVPMPPPADALADRIASTLPSILEFHRDIGLTDADAIVRAGSSFRLGTCFEGWAGDLPPYVHAYGEYGRPFGTASFHLHWIRAAHRKAAAAFDSHSPAAAIARAGRFAQPQDEEGSPLAGFEYGLQLNLPRYFEMMRAYARHLGVTERASDIADVRLRGEDGFIAALKLGDGNEIGGDLFVDCTGPAATLRSALDGAFESWAGWLPCDRVLFADAPPPAEPPALDTVTATPGGWRWQAASAIRTSHGIVYASAQLGDAEAAAALRDVAGTGPAEPPAAIRAGRRAEPWLRNCVAVGDAAVAMEPLEWGNLHLAHSQIDRIVSMMPDRDCGAVELWDYNRQCASEADRMRDFLILHYAASRRSEPMWRAAAAAEPPQSLAHTLSLFRSRGRLPIYEEETFSRDSWLAVLLGQGVIPERTDPLIDSLSPTQADQAMAKMREAIAAMVPTLPSHAAYLRNLSRQFAR